MCYYINSLIGIPLRQEQAISVIKTTKSRRRKEAKRRNGIGNLVMFGSCCDLKLCKAWNRDATLKTPRFLNATLYMKDGCGPCEAGASGIFALASLFKLRGYFHLLYTDYGLGKDPSWD